MIVVFSAGINILKFKKIIRFALQNCFLCLLFSGACFTCFGIKAYIEIFLLILTVEESHTSGMVLERKPSLVFSPYWCMIDFYYLEMQQPSETDFRCKLYFVVL